MKWRHIAAAQRILESESGAIISDWGGKVPIALAYPNRYAVGMSSLAIHGLYRWLNALPGVVCERVFASLDERVLTSDPLITLESQRPVKEMAALALSISFEMDYFHVVNMLQRAAIPLRAAERGRSDPLVIMGGPAVSTNPEPLAPLADAIVIGEAEPLLRDLVACIQSIGAQDRPTALACLARLPGVYVPLLHEGQPIRRQWLRRLDDYPLATSVVAPKAQFGDMHLIEISRGCGRGCRFCLAGHWYRPLRERSLEVILEQAREGLVHADKIGLVASAVSDHSRIDELAIRLREMGAALSVSSLRVDPLSSTLVRALAESGARAITFAPEAGSERLRELINKGVTHQHIIDAVTLAAQYRFESLKLYFMLGLPGEEDEDLVALIDLVREIKRLFPRYVIVNLTPFVPKAHTPFERMAMAPESLLQARAARVRGELGRLGIQVREETAGAARVQGILARGDRAVGEALLAMRHPHPNRFLRALRAQGLEAEMYLGERDPAMPLPWGFIDHRVGSNREEKA